VPVDVYAPGCPPGPQTLIHAIETLRDNIQSGELLRRRDDNGGGAGVHVEQRDGIAAPATVPTPGGR
jgi:NADH-quinone oxidoreductase subunit B